MDNPSSSNANLAQRVIGTGLRDESDGDWMWLALQGCLDRDMGGEFTADAENGGLACGEEEERSFPYHSLLAVV